MREPLLRMGHLLCKRRAFRPVFYRKIWNCEGRIKMVEAGGLEQLNKQVKQRRSVMISGDLIGQLSV